MWFSTICFLEAWCFMHLYCIYVASCRMWQQWHQNNLSSFIPKPEIVTTNRWQNGWKSWNILIAILLPIVGRQLFSEMTAIARRYVFLLILSLYRLFICWFLTIFNLFWFYSLLQLYLNIFISLKHCFNTDSMWPKQF